MMKVLVDTREQLPIFSDYHKRVKLLVGDYSTVKLQKRFSIERKSMQDLYGSIVQGHVRFRKEMIRAENNGIKLCVFVEGTMDEFASLKFPGGSLRKMKGETLLKIVTRMSDKYNVEFVWAKNRKEMAVLTYFRLLYEESKRGTKSVGRKS
jgi:ERCC4-type nuclease